MPVAAQQHSRDGCNNNNILLPDACISYHPALLSEAKATDCLAVLLSPETMTWRCDSIKMFGRQLRQPRLTAWIADSGIDYSYSGIKMVATPWIPLLEDIKETVESAAGCLFNSVLINQYRNGHDHMGWHRDNERELGSEPVIASLSLGSTRFFDLRHRNYRDNRLPVQRFELQSGDLIIMRGKTQQNWQHRVPKKIRDNEVRINLSFRWTSAQPRKPRS